MKYSFCNPICRKWHSMKRVSWRLRSSSGVSSSTTELSLKARNVFIVSYLLQKEGGGEGEAMKVILRTHSEKYFISSTPTTFTRLCLPHKGALPHGHMIKVLIKTANSSNELHRYSGGIWGVRSECLLCLWLPADGRLAVCWTFCGT